AALRGFWLQRRMRLETHKSFEREHWKNQRQRECDREGKPREGNGFENCGEFCPRFETGGDRARFEAGRSCTALRKSRYKQRFHCDGASSEHDWIRGGRVVILPVGHEEKRDDDEESPRESAERFRRAGKEKKQQAAEPERKRKRIHHHNLLSEIGDEW